MSTTKQEAAARLGMGEHEIVDVQESKAGTVIRTFDGVAYIDVGADSPDARGQSGLMYLVAPNPKYDGTFPVFAGHVKQEDQLLKSLGIELDDAPPRPGDDALEPDPNARLTPGDVVAQAEAHVTEPGPGRRGARRTA